MSSTTMLNGMPPAMVANWMVLRKSWPAVTMNSTASAVMHSASTALKLRLCRAAGDTKFDSAMTPESTEVTM